MATFISGATILAMGGPHGAEPFTGDILIEDDRITAIGPGLACPTARYGSTARTSSSCRASSTPISTPTRRCSRSLRQHAPRGMDAVRLPDPSREGAAAAPRLPAQHAGGDGIAEDRRHRITDDLYESPRSEMELLGAAIAAYDDVGIRATVSSHVVDRNFLDTIPFTRDYVPAHLQAEIDGLAPVAIGDYLAFAEEAHRRFHGRSGRIRTMLAPSAPQRCTPELMLAANDLAQSWGVPFHTHILETKVQGVTGPEFYGRSLIAYMDELGLLNPWTTIAHAIWVSDDDIARWAARAFRSPTTPSPIRSSGPAPRPCASYSTRASMSGSARTGSARTTPRGCSTSCTPPGSCIRSTTPIGRAGSRLRRCERPERWAGHARRSSTRRPAPWRPARRPTCSSSI